MIENNILTRKGRIDVNVGTPSFFCGDDLYG